jgi:hypothetical protein
VSDQIPIDEDRKIGDARPREQRRREHHLLLEASSAPGERPSGFALVNIAVAIEILPIDEVAVVKP